MPAKSAKQLKFMQSVLHSDKGFDGGPSKKVAKEFVDKTPKKSGFMKKAHKK
jgi:hypothetical protein